MSVCASVVGSTSFCLAAGWAGCVMHSALVCLVHHVSQAPGLQGQRPRLRGPGPWYPPLRPGSVGPAQGPLPPPTPLPQPMRPHHVPHHHRPYHPPPHHHQSCPLIKHLYLRHYRGAIARSLRLAKQLRWGYLGKQKNIFFVLPFGHIYRRKSASTPKK